MTTPPYSWLHGRYSTMVHISLYALKLFFACVAKYYKSWCYPFAVLAYSWIYQLPVYAYTVPRSFPKLRWLMLVGTSYFPHLSFFSLPSSLLCFRLLSIICIMVQVYMKIHSIYNWINRRGKLILVNVKNLWHKAIFVEFEEGKRKGIRFFFFKSFFFSFDQLLIKSEIQTQPKGTGSTFYVHISNRFKWR